SVRPACVSCQRARRPCLVEAIHPSPAVRASACLAAFSATPNNPSDATSVPVQTGSPPGSTYSPSTVSRSERAVDGPISLRRGSAAAFAITIALLSAARTPQNLQSGAQAVECGCGFALVPVGMHIPVAPAAGPPHHPLRFSEARHLHALVTAAHPDSPRRPGRRRRRQPPAPAARRFHPPADGGPLQPAAAGRTGAGQDHADH